MIGRNRMALVLGVVALGLLVPGLVLPILDLTVQTKVDGGFARLDSTIMESYLSILGAILDLKDKGKGLLALLIFSFGVVVPVLKSVSLASALFVTSETLRRRLGTLVSAIAKWAMAEVFVVAVFLAFLATTDAGHQSTHELKLLGMKVPLQLGLVMRAELGPGFYFFLAYCLVSLVTLHVARID